MTSNPHIPIQTEQERITAEANALVEETALLQQQAQENVLTVADQLQEIMNQAAGAGVSEEKMKEIVATMPPDVQRELDELKDGLASARAHAEATALVPEGDGAQNGTAEEPLEPILDPRGGAWMAV